MDKVRGTYRTDSPAASDYEMLQRKYDSALEVIEKMRAELRQLRRMIFGRRSERFVQQGTLPGQLEIDFGEHPRETGMGGTGAISRDTDSPAEVTEAVRRHSSAVGATGGRHGQRRRFDPTLPVREELVNPPDVPENAVEISRDVTELLEYTPGQLWIRRIIRPRYASGGTVVAAESPSWIPLPRTNAGPSLLAHILVSKYRDHLPLNRQLHILSRRGMTLKSSTLCDWVHAAARLLEPLYDTLVRQVMHSDYLQVDETTIPVLDSDHPGAARKGYHWVVRSPQSRAMFFHYDNGSRARAVASDIFRDFRGALQSDGYNVYDIFENHPGITTIGCWAHARRKFEQALDNDPPRASFALSIIQRMYDIERECRQHNLNPQQVYIIRQQRARPLTEELHRWLMENRSDKRAAIDKAISYTLGIYPRLCRYLDDGRYLIDNNMAENAVRPLALGRKNYLFCGSHRAARNAAMIYSLLGTCCLNGLNPLQWLSDVLCRINDCRTSQLHTLLPGGQAPDKITSDTIR